MSRAYRIHVKESARKVVRAGDQVSTQLELLPVLPPEQLAPLLAEELERGGFHREGNLLRRTTDQVAVTVDATTGIVTVTVETAEAITLTEEKEGVTYDDVPALTVLLRERLRGQARGELDRQAAAHQNALQTAVTDQLEGKLCDLRQELDAVANRVTATALKIKAAQLGQIKTLTEDAQAGTLTIVLEV